MSRTKNSAEVTQRLIRAGNDLFWHGGYNAAGVQQITERAGVPKGSFYNHFPSKEDFGVAVIQHYADYLRQSWADLLKDAPAGAMATLHYIFDHMIAHHDESPECLGCLMGNLAAEITLSSEKCRRALREAQIEWRGRLAHLIMAGQESGEIRCDVPAAILSDLVWDAWEGMLLRMKLELSAKPMRQTLHLVLDVLARDGRHRSEA